MWIWVCGWDGEALHWPWTAWYHKLRHLQLLPPRDKAQLDLFRAEFPDDRPLLIRLLFPR